MGDILGVFSALGDAKILALLGILMWLDMRGAFKDMAKAVQLLTVQMATIVDRVDGHEKRIDRLEVKN